MWEEKDKTTQDTIGKQVRTKVNRTQDNKGEKRRIKETQVLSMQQYMSLYGFIVIESLTSMSSQSRDPEPYCSRHWWAALYRTPGSTEFRDSLSFTGASSRHHPQPRLWGAAGGKWMVKKRNRGLFVICTPTQVPFCNISINVKHVTLQLTFNHESFYKDCISSSEHPENILCWSMKFSSKVTGFSYIIIAGMTATRIFFDKKYQPCWKN